MITIDLNEDWTITSNPSDKSALQSKLLPNDEIKGAENYRELEELQEVGFRVLAVRFNDTLLKVDDFNFFPDSRGNEFSTITFSLNLNVRNIFHTDGAVIMVKRNYV